MKTTATTTRSQLADSTHHMSFLLMLLATQDVVEAFWTCSSPL